MISHIFVADDLVLFGYIRPSLQMAIDCCQRTYLTDNNDKKEFFLNGPDETQTVLVSFLRILFSLPLLPKTYLINRRYSQ